jgi:hypothetical protein
MRLLERRTRGPHQEEVVVAVAVAVADEKAEEEAAVDVLKAKVEAGAAARVDATERIGKTSESRIKTEIRLRQARQKSFLLLLCLRWPLRELRRELGPRKHRNALQSQKSSTQSYLLRRNRSQ